MSVATATAILYKPTTVVTFFPKLKSRKTLSHPEFPTSKLVFSGESVSKKPFSWNNRTLGPNIMTQLTTVAAFRDNTGEEGFGAFEQEAFIHRSSHFSPESNFMADRLEPTLNNLSKWLIAALFCAVLLWRHDVEALWAAMGSCLNAGLSITLKHILNEERPVSTLRSDPGMPSSHAQSIFFSVMFLILSIMATGFATTSYEQPSGCWRFIRICLLHFVVLVLGCNCAASIYLPFVGPNFCCSGSLSILSRLSFICHSILGYG